MIFPFTILDSFAVGDAFLTEMCNVSNVVTGNGGKAFAAFAVIASGIGFFTGRVSWGLLIGISMGIGSIFGAPSIVAAISGQSAFECEVGAIYVTTCSNGVCSACPRGHTGVGCSACATGFTGANCATCDTGYISALCDSCDTQYTKLNGVCQLKKCDSGPIVGVAAANSSVDLGNSSLNCDATNYSGNVTYSCSNGSFSIITNSCICPVKYDQSNCTSCATGYSGAPGCNGCSTNYTKVAGICQEDCTTSGFVGIPDDTPAIAPSGTLSCISAGYQSTINYTCSSGSFASSDSCTCANGYVPNGSGCIIIQDCTGGAITTVSSKKIHLFAASGSFFTCPTSRTVEYLIIGGGGGGGYDGAGGGGFQSGSFTVSTSPYSITVGTGGAKATSVGSQASDGLSSSFNGITANGGGGGGSKQANGRSGTSGGGAGHHGSTVYTGGTGSGGGNGGNGASTGGGGGGGGSYQGSGTGVGGTGGGGTGGRGTARLSSAGADGYGGGGGGGGEAANAPGSKGGSGFVIISY